MHHQYNVSVSGFTMTKILKYSDERKLQVSEIVCLKDWKTAPVAVDDERFLIHHVFFLCVLVFIITQGKK